MVLNLVQCMPLIPIMCYNDKVYFCTDHLLKALHRRHSACIIIYLETEISISFKIKFGIHTPS